jgi:hypothetical protein
MPVPLNPIVDDNPDAADSLARLLGLRGHQVEDEAGLEGDLCRPRGSTMELDRKLEREILTQVRRGGEEGVVTVNVEVPGYGKGVISEHVRLLFDAGCVEADDAADEWVPTGLTRVGHGYLEKLEGDAI